MGIEARADKGKGNAPGPATQSGLNVFDAFHEVDNFENVAELDLSDDLLTGLSNGPADADLKLARDLAGFGPRSDKDFNALVDRGDEQIVEQSNSEQPVAEPAVFSVNPERDLPQIEVVNKTETAEVPAVTEEQMTASVDRAKNLLPAGNRSAFENRMGMVGDRLSSLT
ncbi:MAG: hypothetical protein AB7W16_16505 [Candidatus Obscuribacterales bacterium]